MILVSLTAHHLVITLHVIMLSVIFSKIKLRTFLFYSIRVIRDWAKDPQRRKCPGLGLFTSKRMEDVVFEDLKIRLGYPYLYCHQGNCEHLIIFTDLR